MFPDAEVIAGSEAISVYQEDGGGGIINLEEPARFLIFFHRLCAETRVLAEKVFTKAEALRTLKITRSEVV